MWTTVAIIFGIIALTAVFVIIHYACFSAKGYDFDSEVVSSVCAIDGFATLALIILGGIFNNFLVGLGLLLIIPFILTLISYLADKGFYWVVKDYLAELKEKEKNK